MSMGLNKLASVHYWLLSAVNPSSYGQVVFGTKAVPCEYKAKNATMHRSALKLQSICTNVTLQ